MSWRDGFRSEPMRWSSEFIYRAMLRTAIRRWRRGLRLWWWLDRRYAGTWRSFPARVGKVLLSVKLDDPVGRAVFYGDGPLRYEAKTSAALLQELGHGDVFLDGGACCGWFTALAANTVGPEGLIVAIEADPQRARVLEDDLRRSKAENVSVVGAALGSKSARAMLRSPPSHFHESQRTIGSAQGSDHNGVDVEVIALDSLDLTRLDVVKLDIEGAEIEALGGARTTLVKCRPRLLLIEAMEENLRRFGKSLTDLAAIVDQLGYVPDPIADGSNEAPMWACRPKEEPQRD
jgi:FkbM family methyltransferase